MKTQTKKIKLKCKSCNRFFYDSFMDMDANYYFIEKTGRCYRCEDKTHHTIEDNPEGVFYCPSCNIRTNEKTIWTTCVICKGHLQRTGR